MSETTLRPNATIENEGGTVTGAASVDAALADNSDATHVSYPVPGRGGVTFGDLTLPSGALIKSISGRIRSDVTAGTWRLSSTFTPPAQRKTINANWTSPLTVNIVTISGAFSDAELDAATLTWETEGLFGGGSIKLTAAYLDVTYVEQPEVSAVSPAGELTTDNRPAVEWEDTLDTDGGAQTYFEAKVFDKATYEAEGFNPDTSEPTEESGITSGSVSSWDSTEGLADGDYRAYVRVAQTVNGAKHWSDWDFSAFTVKVKTPADPTVIASPEYEDARIALSLEGGEGGEATTQGFQVQWSHDGGFTWINLRTEDGEGYASGTSLLLYDHDAPNGETVKYRVRAWHSYEGVKAFSSWVETSSAWESGERWLKHPTSPSLNRKVEPYSYQDASRKGRRAVLQPLGSTSPVVVSDTREARSGTLVLWVETNAEREELEALFNTLDPLLLQMAAGDEKPDRWVVFGDESGQSIVDKLQVADTLITLEWAEVERP